MGQINVWVVFTVYLALFACGDIIETYQQWNIPIAAKVEHVHIVNGTSLSEFSFVSDYKQFKCNLHRVFENYSYIEYHEWYNKTHQESYNLFLNLTLEDINFWRVLDADQFGRYHVGRFLLTILFDAIGIIFSIWYPVKEINHVVVGVAAAFAMIFS